MSNFSIVSSLIFLISVSAHGLDLVTVNEGGDSSRQTNQACLNALLDGVPHEGADYLATPDGIVEARGNSVVVYKPGGSVSLGSKGLSCEMAHAKNSDKEYAELVRRHLALAPTDNRMIYGNRAYREKASKLLKTCEGPLTLYSPSGLAALKNEASGKVIFSSSGSVH